MSWRTIITVSLWIVIWFSVITVSSTAAVNITTVSNELDQMNHRLTQLHDKVNTLDEYLNDIIYRYYSFAIDRIVATSGPRFFSEWKPIIAPGAISVDSFYVSSSGQQQQYLVITSTEHGNLSIYAVGRKDIQHVQTISTPGVLSSTPVYINKTLYLAVACCCDDEGVNLRSHLYTWNGHSLQLKQYLPTSRARGVSFAFTSRYDIFLAFSSSGLSNPSQVYKWNTTNNIFQLYQTLNTSGGAKVHFFYTSQQLWLTIACQYSNSEKVHSYIYKWNGSLFVVYQAIPSFQTMDLFPLFAGNNMYLIAAHYSAKSVVYRFNRITKQFEQFQTISTRGAVAVDYFIIRNEYFISIANSWDQAGGTSRTKSVIYKFDGSTFELFQEIATVKAASVRGFFTLWECWLLVVANEGGNRVIVYKWGDASGDSLCDN